MEAPRKFRFIGCEIVYREACYLAATGPHRVDVEFLRKGLHDLQRQDMNAKIQSTIDATDPAQGYEAILLGYARCNDGLAGITARGIPLVIPRAHDCITLFFGSRGAYQQYFNANAGTYYMTTGWSERNAFGEGDSHYTQPAYGKTGVMGNLGLTESYEQMVEKYGKENADFIMESMGDWRKNYSKCLFLEMGITDERPFIAHAQAEAAERGWKFEQKKGSLSLLQKLFFGQWDEDFVIVPPGGHIVARNDERIIEAEK